MVLGFAPLPAFPVNHNVLVIAVNFQDKSDVYDPASYQSTISQLNSFYSEVSGNRVSFTGDVMGRYTIAVSSTNCDKALIATDAKQAAVNAGAVLSNYQHLFYLMPNTSACAWFGNSTLGGSPTEEWFNGDFSLPVVAHEMGHGFGLFHSKSLDCGTTASICSTSVGTVDEYGDRFDVMGGNEAPSVTGHPNLFQKEKLGWANIQTVANGSYFITPFETTSNGLRILNSYDPQGRPTYYYVEFRRLTGYDQGYSPYQPPPFDGLLIHQGTPNGGDVYLLDMTPDTVNWYDARLPVSSTFSDGNVSITLTSFDDTGATVNVQTLNPPPPPTPTPTPTPSGITSVTITTDKTTYKAGSPVTVTTKAYSGTTEVPATPVTLIFDSGHGQPTVVNTTTGTYIFKTTKKGTFKAEVVYNNNVSAYTLFTIN